VEPEHVERLGALIAVVRRALVARAIVQTSGPLAVVAGGLVLVAVVTVPGLVRAPWLALLALGPLVGALRARRARPSDADVVLHLDQRLRAGAALVTAWECGRSGRPVPPRTRHAAVTVLGDVRARDVRPRVLGRSSWALGGAAGVWALVFVVPGPAPAGVRPDPRVRLEDVTALRRIERLPEDARTPEERRAFDAAARNARSLAHALHEGMEPREALDRVASLRAQLEAARPRETSDERRARDAALEALATEPALRDALAARDVEAFDRSVERAAARREAADRERARDALRAAAQAAAAAGDPGLERSLLRREAQLARRARQAALARDLLEAMPELRAEGMQRALARLERDGDGDALTREAVDAMREAWSRLSAEERRRFAEAVRDMQVAENDAAQDAQSARRSRISMRRAHRSRARPPGRVASHSPGRARVRGRAAGRARVRARARERVREPEVRARARVREPEVRARARVREPEVRALEARARAAVREGAREAAVTDRGRGAARRVRSQRRAGPSRGYVRSPIPRRCHLRAW
jgi:hypothetical protein